MREQSPDGPAGALPPTWLDRSGLAICALWGFAEATLFFVVPDVAVGALGLFRPRRALPAAGAAVAGAVLGGIAIYALGLGIEANVRDVMDAVPAITPAMIDSAREGLLDRGGFAMFIGVSEGIPYKIYASEWAVLGWGLPALVAWTMPARAFRIVLVGLIAAAVGSIFRRSVSRRPGAWASIYAIGWIAFYIVYWFVVVPKRFG